MRSTSIKWAVCALLAIVILAQPEQSVGNEQCKELNQVNCYVSKNEGNYCNRKDQTSSETRWHYDKGDCKKFHYRGCNGNRNRFCTKESCEQRCKDQ